MLLLALGQRGVLRDDYGVLGRYISIFPFSWAWFSYDWMIL